MGKEKGYRKEKEMNERVVLRFDAHHKLENALTLHRVLPFCSFRHLRQSDWLRSEGLGRPLG